uniref:Uncharacterized protein n=1 Tax=Steinernema glaseri TaxID=37863 RepID=A0A1I8AFN0_9BILA
MKVETACQNLKKHLQELKMSLNKADFDGRVISSSNNSACQSSWSFALRPMRTSPTNRKLVEAYRPYLGLGGPQRRREPGQDEGGGRVLESEEAPPGPGDELAHGRLRWDPDT